MDDEEMEDDVGNEAFIQIPNIGFLGVQTSSFDREVCAQVKAIHACLMGIAERSDRVELLQGFIEEIFWEANITMMMRTAPETTRKLMLDPMRRTAYILDIQGRASDALSRVDHTPISVMNIFKEMGINP